MALRILPARAMAVHNHKLCALCIIAEKRRVQEAYLCCGLLGVMASCKLEGDWTRYNSADGGMYDTWTGADIVARLCAIFTTDLATEKALYLINSTFSQWNRCTFRPSGRSTRAVT